ncbi:hypothetical protein [Mucilaginibacter antarcticus]|uniref:Outer membrane protein with beta-barrel domain n=1 Tax=Mucilaginibacter antarcticus TaxID=1855725 RepID=A0ABW5XT97_9SPHI
MKSTLKTLVYTLLFISISSAAKAQLTVPDSLRIGLGGGLFSTTGSNFGTDVNVPTNAEAGAAYSYGAGVALKVDIPVLSHVLVTASVGYNTFFKSANGNKSQQAITNATLPNFNTIPLKVGVKLFVGGDRFYAQGEVGETLLANKKALYAMYSNAFTWSPGIGMIFPLQKHHRYIDAGIRFESTQTFYNNNNNNNFWALHLAYAFNLK